jgi:hypothetical protein
VLVCLLMEGEEEPPCKEEVVLYFPVRLEMAR